MFFVIALTIWTAMNVYVLWRVRSVAAVRRTVPRWAFVAAGVLLASSYIAARMLHSVVLEWIGATWMGALVIALGCFFIADVVTGFGFFARRYVPAMRAAALIASALLASAALVNTFRVPVVRNHEVRIANLPAERDGTVAVALTDLHLGTLTRDRWYDDVVRRVDSLQPDILLIAGDLTEGHGMPDAELESKLKRLRAPLGVWYSSGNHDRREDEILRKAGFRVLRDAAAEAVPGLHVAGINVVGHSDRGTVERAAAGVPREAAAILLAHYPEKVEDAERAGVDLMISGHTHNGQVWPFGYFVRLAFPRIVGSYDVGAMTLLVCSGTGTWGPPMRLFRPNEVLRIVLRRA